MKKWQIILAIVLVILTVAIYFFARSTNIYSTRVVAVEAGSPVGIAQTFTDQVKRDEPIILNPEANPLVVALREHMKRTPLWVRIDKWNVHLQKIENLEKKVQDKIGIEVDGDNHIRSLTEEPPKQTFNSLITVFALQFRRWTHGHQPFDIENDFEKDEVGNGLVQPHIGAYRFDVMSPEKAEKLKRIILDYESRMKQWKEITEMQDLLKEKGKQGQELNIELSYIIHRRVIPGKCRYCPW